jgi:endonuclease-3
MASTKIDAASSEVSPTRNSKRPKVTAQDVMEYMAPEYGPAEWYSRYTPAEELVYTILSQHTSDLNSERAFNNLIDTFGSVEGVAAAPVPAIEKAIRMGGLAKQKAPRIKQVLEQIIEENGNLDLYFLAEMPLEEAKAWLKRLNGIGPKTAAIILCFSLGMPAMPVDTHIYRVSQRLGLIGPKINADKAHDILEPMVAPEEVFPFHMYLIRHGRQICKAQRPKCGECLMGWGCPSKPKIERAAVAEAKKKAKRLSATKKRKSK